jgi:hypothetical protein
LGGSVLIGIVLNFLGRDLALGLYLRFDLGWNLRVTYQGRLDRWKRLNRRGRVAAGGQQ